MHEATDIRFTPVSRTTVRHTITRGKLPELEFGLLRRFGDQLNWGTDEKAVLLDMAIDILSAKAGHMTFEVEIRSLCHSRDVTCDYLKYGERFNMKQCALVLGDLGLVAAPWAQLIQPAVHLHMHDYNVVMVAVEEFAHDAAKWFKFGAGIIKGILRHLQIVHISVLACGMGGAIFLEALAQSPELFGRTHVVYNLDLPPVLGAEIPVSVLEEYLRDHELQLWFPYSDDPPHFDRQVDGTPAKAFEQVSKLQVRLEGERARGRRSLPYDEMLITDRLNNPVVSHASRVQIGDMACISCSKAFLDSLTRFLQTAPAARQAAVDANQGLVPDTRDVATGRSPSKLNAQGRSASKTVDGELPALRKLRLGPDTDKRHRTADHNRRRAGHFDQAMCALEPPRAQDVFLDPRISPGSSSHYSHGLGQSVPQQAALLLASGAAGPPRFRGPPSKALSMTSDMSMQSRSSTIDVLASAMFFGGQGNQRNRSITLSPRHSDLDAFSPSASKSQVGSRVGTRSALGSKDRTKLRTPESRALRASRVQALARLDAEAEEDDDDAPLFDDKLDYKEQWANLRSGFGLSVSRSTPALSRPQLAPLEEDRRMAGSPLAP